MNHDLYEFIISNKCIDNELVKYFHDYNKNYILFIIKHFRKNELLPLDNSVPGWNLYVKQHIINNIKKYIQNDLNNSKKKLKFTYVYNQLHTYDNDVLRKIWSLIK